MKQQLYLFFLLYSLPSFSQEITQEKVLAYTKDLKTPVVEIDKGTSLEVGKEDKNGTCKILLTVDSFKDRTFMKKGEFLVLNGKRYGKALKDFEFDYVLGRERPSTHMLIKVMGLDPESIAERVLEKLLKKESHQTEHSLKSYFGKFKFGSVNSSTYKPLRIYRMEESLGDFLSPSSFRLLLVFDEKKQLIGIVHGERRFQVQGSLVKKLAKDFKLVWFKTHEIKLNPFVKEFNNREL